MQNSLAKKEKKAQNSLANKPKKPIPPVVWIILGLVLGAAVVIATLFLTKNTPADNQNLTTPVVETTENSNGNVLIEQESEPEETPIHEETPTTNVVFEPEYSQGLEYDLLSDGTYSVTGLGSFTGTNVVIPATYNGKSVSEIGERALMFSENLASVEIPEGVKTIGKMAFWQCNALESVSIPSSVTTIDEGAFGYCTSLTELILPSNLTTIGEGAFKNSGLWKLTIPGSVTTMGRMILLNSPSLTSVTISDGVSVIGKQTFNGCPSLQNVTIPDSVTEIKDDAFSYCVNLKEIVVPESVTTMGEGVFGGNTMTVYAEAAEEPANWATRWKTGMYPGNIEVVWGYNG